jgi:hypothetical protein
MVVSYEHGPAPVWILLAEQEILSTFSFVCAFRPERKHRITCGFQCNLHGARKRRPASARKLPTTKFR